MKKIIIIILLIMLSIPAMNQETDKTKDKFGDVFDKREEDENYLDSADVRMYKEEKKLKSLTKKERLIWAFRTAKDDPFI